MSKGLNFPDGLFSRIFDHNIYQRCAASPQDIVAQIFKKISPSWKWTFDTLIFIGNFSFHIKQKTLREDTLPIDNSNFPHFKFATTTFCLLCQWLYCILQPLKSGFCHPRTIVIALSHFRFWWFLNFVVSDDWFTCPSETRSPGSKVFIIFERDFALVVTYVSYFRDIK